MRGPMHVLHHACRARPRGLVPRGGVGGPGPRARGSGRTRDQADGAGHGRVRARCGDGPRGLVAGRRCNPWDVPGAGGYGGPADRPPDRRRARRCIRFGESLQVPPSAGPERGRRDPRRDATRVHGRGVRGDRRRVPPRVSGDHAVDRHHRRVSGGIRRAVRIDDGPRAPGPAGHRERHAILRAGGDAGGVDARPDRRMAGEATVPPAHAPPLRDRAGDSRAMDRTRGTRPRHGTGEARLGPRPHAGVSAGGPPRACADRGVPPGPHRIRDGDGSRGSCPRPGGDADGFDRCPCIMTFALLRSRRVAWRESFRITQLALYGRTNPRPQPRGVAVKHSGLWNPRRQFESARGYPMKARARITLTFDDAATAEAVATSVSLDDDGYIRTNRRGRTIAADASAESAMSLLHTLDDYLACVSVAERTVRAARPRARGRRRRA